MPHEQCRELYTKAMQDVRSRFEQDFISSAEATTKADKGDFKLGDFKISGIPSCCNFRTRALGWASYLEKHGNEKPAPKVVEAPSAPEIVDVGDVPVAVQVEPAPKPSDDTLPQAIKDNFDITLVGDSYELYCKHCKKGWGLKVGDKHPGNVLFLMEHAARHGLR